MPDPVSTTADEHADDQQLREREYQPCEGGEARLLPALSHVHNPRLSGSSSRAVKTAGYVPAAPTFGAELSACCESAATGVLPSRRRPPRTMRNTARASIAAPKASSPAVSRPR